MTVAGSSETCLGCGEPVPCPSDCPAGVARPSNPCNVPEILRSIVREGNAWPSAGIIGEAANLLDDTDTLLGRLAECFGDDETEFADIKLMRDRIAAIDTRDRHDATDDSARRHAPETNAVHTRWCTQCATQVGMFDSCSCGALKASEIQWRCPKTACRWSGPDSSLRDRCCPKCGEACEHI